MKIPDILRIKKYHWTNFKLENEYVVNQIFKKYGHSPLSIPPYNYTFCPIKLVVGVIKSHSRKYSQLPTEVAVAIY